MISTTRLLIFVLALGQALSVGASTAKKRLAHLITVLDELPQLRKKYQLNPQESFAPRLSSDDWRLVSRAGREEVFLDLLTNKSFTISLPSIRAATEKAYEQHLDIPLYAHYIGKLAHYKITDLEAIERALARQHYDRWAEKRIAETAKREPSDPFVNSLGKLAISENYRSRLLKAYSLCVDSYRQPENRLFMRKITVEKPLDGFGRPPIQENLNYSPMIPRIDEANFPPYKLLVEAVREVAREQQLDEWHRACLAKCVGDEMVVFKPASRNLLHALLLFSRSMLGDGAENLSSAYGVCTTYARITKEIAEELGFGGRVRIGSKGLHFFNQIKIAGNWYHFHPLRKYGKDCSFFPYP